MRRKHNECSIEEHDWKPMKRGAKREQCSKCKTVYPCRGTCGHLDCIMDRDEELPDWARPEQAS